MLVQSNQIEVINYFMNLLNTNIDLTDIVDDNLNQVFDDTSFAPVIFKTEDDGSITPIPASEIIGQQTPRKTYIPVSFSGASLNKENIFKIGNYPIESWVGVVEMQLLVPISNTDIFSDVYARLEDFQETNLINNVVQGTIFGAIRSIQTFSRRIADMPGSTVLINRYEYKTINISVTVSITNKDLLRGNYRQFEIDGQLVSTLSKAHFFQKQFEDSTNSNTVMSKFVADSAFRTTTITVPFDWEMPFIQKLWNEIKATGSASEITQTYSVKHIYIFPNGVPRDYTLQMGVDSIEEILSEVGAVSLKVTFREVV